MPTSGSSVPDPTVAPAEELRWRLGALVSAHGQRLANDAEAWRACEIELSALYSGPYAVRTYAVVQALKGGLVADLVNWYAEGARGFEPELAQRLTERSGVSRPIAEWAIGAWAFAFGQRPVSNTAPTAAPTATVTAAASAPLAATPVAVSSVSPADAQAPAGREIVVRIPHLIGAGAVTAFAVTVLFASGFAAVPRALGLFGDAAASTPALPPAPDLEPLPRASRTTSNQERWETPVDAPRCNTDDVDGRWNERPRLLTDHRPAFPGDLLDEGYDRGRVTLRFTVSAEGRVETESVEVLRSSHPLFAQSAIEVLEHLRYRPARSNGCAVSAEVVRTFEFR